MARKGKMSTIIAKNKSRSKYKIKKTKKTKNNINAYITEQNRKPRVKRNGIEITKK